MQNGNDFDGYQLALGRTIANLHSLECLLRLFLHNVESSRYNSPPPEVGLNKVKVGDVVPENYFTNYDGLGELVEKYNRLVTCRGAPELCVDGAVVKLRDALAHGRVLGMQPKPPFQLYKFKRPSKSRQVVVEDVIVLNKVEQARHINRTYDSMQEGVQGLQTVLPKRFRLGSLCFREHGFPPIGAGSFLIRLECLRESNFDPTPPTSALDAVGRAGRGLLRPQPKEPAIMGAR